MRIFNYELTEYGHETTNGHGLVPCDSDKAAFFSLLRRATLFELKPFATANEMRVKSGRRVAKQETECRYE